jgi:membrane-bound serine protease (ClpP class)
LTAFEKDARFQSLIVEIMWYRIGGIVSLVISSLMLFQPPVSSFRVSWSVLLPAMTITSLSFIAVIAITVKAQLHKPVGGQEGLRGEEGQAMTDVHADGTVLIHGEYWSAVSDIPVAKGEKVRVVRVDHLKVKVKPIEK